MKTILVLGIDGWCRAEKKKALRYQDSVKTECGFHLLFPFGFKKVGKPTCFDCVKKETKDGRLHGTADVRSAR